MKLPLVLSSRDRKIGLTRWKKQFAKNPRQEVIWRRNQIPANKDISNWKTAEDSRWRILHAIDSYSLKTNGLKQVNFCLKSMYLCINHCLPRQELAEVYSNALKQIESRNFKEIKTLHKTVFKKKDLRVEVTHLDTQEKKDKFYPNISPNYEILDIKLFFGKNKLTIEKKSSPWMALKSGIRVRKERGKPTYTKSIREIQKYLPCQVELGSGVSTELGIPPINYLYDTYQVTNRETGKLIFGIEDTLFEKIINDVESFLQKTSKVMVSAWEANENSIFYMLLKKGIEKGVFLQPIITNNYDNILKLHNIKINTIRRFDEKKVDTFRFHPKAKSLLVIGVHADRRNIHDLARKSGLKVIFVDPEVYLESSGRQTKYQLESPQDGDLIFNLTASEFAKIFSQEIIDI